MTLVSVLTPSFQQGRFIGRCIESVACQTYRPIEHIVVDGGSTDGTVAILRRASPNVEWVSEPDNGQADALNKAFARSRGEVIGWLNSDDAYADRRAVERAVGVLESRPEVDIVFGDSLLVNEQDEVLQVLAALPFSIWAYRRIHYVIQPSLFFRRRALDVEPYFLRTDLDFVMDRELILRLAKRGRRFARSLGFVAIDRHQHERKVLRPEFKAEANAFDATLGVGDSPGTAAARRGIRLLIRLTGARPMLRLEKSLDPAFGLRVPPRWRRMRFQLLTPRRRMKF